MKTFTVEFTTEPRRNRSFKVRGICKCDVLNPCWDNRKTDIPGLHWSGAPACEPCAEAATSLIDVTHEAR
jgi:hypothetical protein